MQRVFVAVSKISFLWKLILSCRKLLDFSKYEKRIPGMADTLNVSWHHSIKLLAFISIN